MLEVSFPIKLIFKMPIMNEKELILETILS